jgi:putative MATE family efflux protein
VIRGSLVRIDDLDRRIVALALPALGALLVEPLYNLTDSGIVGHLGRAPLGALAIAGGALAVVWWTAAFIEMSTVTLVAQRQAAHDTDGARRGVGAAYFVSLAVGAFVAALILVLASPLTALLGGKGLVARDAVTYLRISAVGMVPLVSTFAGTGHLIGLGNTKRPFAIALVSNGINIALEILLVYVVHLGIAGSAWGTVAAQFASAALFLASSLRAPVRPARPLRGDVARLARDGVPLTIRTVALGVALLSTTAVAARLGEAILAGHQIALQIWLLLALTLDALAVPAQVFVGQAVGSGDSSTAARVGRRALRLGLYAGVGLGIATVAVAGVLPAVFTNDPVVRHEATLALIVCGCQQPVAALAFVLDGLLLGASDFGILRTAMLVALAGFAPVAAIVLRLHWLGIVGLWLALTCWLVVRTAVLLHRWVSRAWELPVLAG